MAISDKAINVLEQGINTGRAIPGQSLVNSPDQPYNWERPTEFTSSKEAMLHVFEVLTVPETVTNIMYALNDGVGVVDIASITLYSGFLEGKWNPDLMVLLMEPTMYMVMALAEKAEIEYDLEAGDREQAKIISPQEEISKLKEGISELDKLRSSAVDKINPQVVPEEIREMVEEKELPKGLLERNKEKEPEGLLSKGK